MGKYELFADLTQTELDTLDVMLHESLHQWENGADLALETHSRMFSEIAYISGEIIYEMEDSPRAEYRKQRAELDAFRVDYEPPECTGDWEDPYASIELAEPPGAQDESWAAYWGDKPKFRDGE